MHKFKIAKKIVAHLSGLDILDVVTLGGKTIVPAIESTTDLWFECTAHIGGPPNHFIIKDDFTECLGVEWGYSHRNRPDGTIICRSFDLVMTKEDLKKVFDAAFPTSRLGKAMGCDKHA